MPYRKLSSTDENAIVEEISTKHTSMTDLAQRYGVSQSCISIAFQRVTGKTLREFRANPTKVEIEQTELIKRFIEKVLGDEYELLCAVAKETEMHLGEVVRILMAYRAAKRKACKQP